MEAWGTVIHYKYVDGQRILVGKWPLKHRPCNCAACQMDRIVAMLGGENIY